jgi:hypothetical protein
MASAGQARVQHPAPDFTCTAVANGGFEGTSPNVDPNGWNPC